MNLKKRLRTSGLALLLTFQLSNSTMPKMQTKAYDNTKYNHNTKHNQHIEHKHYDNTSHLLSFCRSFPKAPHETQTSNLVKSTHHSNNTYHSNTQSHRYQSTTQTTSYATQTTQTQTTEQKEKWLQKNLEVLTENHLGFQYPDSARVRINNISTRKQDKYTETFLSFYCGNFEGYIKTLGTKKDSVELMYMEAMLPNLESPHKKWFMRYDPQAPSPIILTEILLNDSTFTNPEAGTSMYPFAYDPILKGSKQNTRIMYQKLKLYSLETELKNIAKDLLK